MLMDVTMKTNEFQLSMKRVGKLKVRKGFDFKIDVVYEDKVYEVYWNDQLISFETNKKKIKKEIVLVFDFLWEVFAKCDDLKLTNDAKELKKRLLEAFEE